MSDIYGSIGPNDFEQVETPKPWIWEGYIARGRLTLFTSVWKSGKTTLLAHLLSQRRCGGTFADRTVPEGATVIVSEEAREQWRERHLRLEFGSRDRLFLCPFVGLPSMPVWKDFIAHVGEVAAAGGHDLVVIDPLARFLPSGAEYSAPVMVEAMAPLLTLTRAGLGILLLHHPSKTPAAEGMAARGCGAPPAMADFILEMRGVDAANREDRRRRIVAFSRDSTTPRSLIMELSADGLHYARCDEPAPPDDFGVNWSVLRIVFEDAKHELTRQEIESEWPSDFPRPQPSTLWKWLSAAHERGLIARSGTGRRTDPHRFFLPEKMAIWKADPMFEFNQKMIESAKVVEQSLTGYQPNRWS